MTTETAKSVFASEGHPCFKYKLNDPKGFWNGGGVVAGNHQVLQATASTERFWEEEPEEEIKRKVQDAKIKFHKDRQLQVKHLPRNVSEEVSNRHVVCYQFYRRFFFSFSIDIIYLIIAVISDTGNRTGKCPGVTILVYTCDYGFDLYAFGLENPSNLRHHVFYKDDFRP